MANSSLAVGQWNKTNDTYGLSRPLYNYVDNGEFVVNLRKPTAATALTVSGFAYAQDRWLAVHAGGVGTFTVTPVPLTNATNQVVNAANPDVDAVIRVQGNTTTLNATSRIEQWIPNMKQFATKWLTVSGFMSANIAPATVKLEVTEFYGSGGSPSASVQHTSPDTILTTVGLWTPITFSFQITSFSGKAFGTDGLQGLILRAYPESIAGVTFDMYMCLFQIEEGQDYTGFHKKSQQEEEENCRRYYQKSFGIGVAPAQNVGSVGRKLQSMSNNGANYFVDEKFPTVMNKIPSMVMYNSAAANAQVHNFTTGTDSAGVTPNPGRTGYELTITPPAGWANGNLGSWQWEAKGDNNDPA